MFTWPAAPVLAQFIWYNREHITGKQVIEVCANDNEILFTTSIMVQEVLMLLPCVSFKIGGGGGGKELFPS